jgi:small-conductance mechanosensitive channel
MDWTFLEKAVEHPWVRFVVVSGFAFLTFELVQRVLLPKIKGHKTHQFGIFDFLEIVQSKTTWIFGVAFSLYFGTQVLRVPAKLDRGIDRFILLVAVFQIWIWISNSIRVFLDHRSSILRQSDPEKLGTLRVLRFVLYFLVFVMLVLFTLDNFGVNIGTLVAGLGVGGIAVALAVQNILGDFLASMTLIFDKPFVVGDYIAVGDVGGTVENIGIKTTRLRSLSGQEISVPNSDLLSSRVNNYKRMQERRVPFKFGIRYETPLDKVQAIPGMVKEIITSKQSVRFDRCHFFNFGNYSLEFEAVYIVLSADYNLFMDIHQRVCLEIAAAFAAEEIIFAYPTQTLYVQSLNAGGEVNGSPT